MLSSLMRRLNERRAAEFEAEGSAEAGFTLIELMVVLLILAILLAIAIPTFLGVTGSANDRAAQSNLNTALTNAKSNYQQNNQAYTLYDSQLPTALPLIEPLAVTIQTNEPSLPMLTTNTGIVAGFPNGVAAATAGKVTAVTDIANPNGAVLMALANKTNECWWVADNTSLMGAVPGPTAASLPWITGAGPTPTTTAAKETTGGVPYSAGIVYGVYLLGTGQATCDSGVLGSAKSWISSTAFPTAPTTT
jgi:type IV pilus assembly protein PilA